MYMRLSPEAHIFDPDENGKCRYWFAPDNRSADGWATTDMLIYCESAENDAIHRIGRPA